MNTIVGHVRLGLLLVLKSKAFGHVEDINVPNIATVSRFKVFTHLDVVRFDVSVFLMTGVFNQSMVSRNPYKRALPSIVSSANTRFLK
jgi:hypothetical protein